MADVVSLGSINVDLVRFLPRAEIDDLAARHDWFPAPGETVVVEAVPPGLGGDDVETFLGGKGANQAVAAARAGAGTELLGRVGPDEAEYGVLDSLAASGVTVDGVGVARTDTGKAHVFVDGDGESFIALVEGANDAVDPEYVDRRYRRIADADCLLLQNEVPLAALDHLLSALRCEPDRPTVVFDPAPAAGAGRLLGHDSIDVIVPNETEYDALDGLRGYGGTVVRTRGPEAVIVEGDGGGFSVEPPEVDPVDTTAAGDVFSGYLAAELAAGAPLREAVELACVAATRSTLTAGAQDSIPRREELDPP